MICTKLPAEVYSSKGNSENFVERAMEYTSPYEASQLLAHMRETEFVKGQIMQMDDTRAVAVCSMFEGDQVNVPCKRLNVPRKHLNVPRKHLNVP
jgi:hypothetical protein